MTSEERKQQQQQSLLTPVNHNKAFYRSSPRPQEMEQLDRLHLVNNQNNFQKFLNRPDEQYKVKVFENFKVMKSQMNKAFLRQQENKRFFKGNSAVPEE